MTKLTKKGWSKFWKSVKDSESDDKDTQDWLDMISGKIVGDADPYNKEFARSVRQALLDTKVLTNKDK